MRRQYYSATAGRLCDCGSNKPKIYRCMDCTVNVPWCEACIVAKHYYEPLHAIERWTERHFVRDSLYKLGLIYHLGHGGSRCTELGKNATPSNVSVTDINGTHKVRIMYCHCISAKSQFLQLLEGGIFASSVKSPSAGFTTRCLQDFHMIALASKKSAFDYAKVLCQKTSALPFEVEVSFTIFVDQFLLELTCIRTPQIDSRE